MFVSRNVANHFVGGNVANILGISVEYIYQSIAYQNSASAVCRIIHLTECRI